jgi:DNA invertase Pin-like site-specific DNA recombinase
MRRAIIGYVRVSTYGQAEDGVSLDAQRAKIEAWAELNGYGKGVEIYTDAGLSGCRAENRPGLQAALSAAVEGRGVLVVSSLSRLTRSTADTLALSERIERAGADLVSLSERIDTTTAAGKLTFRLLAVLNEFERDQVSERTRAALAHKRATGQKTGGCVPFGYDDQGGGKLIENQVEQQTLDLIWRLRRQGCSLRRIAAELEKREIRTKTGKRRWNPKTVAAIVKRSPGAACAA